MPATAHDVSDDVARTAVMSAFAPELALLTGGLTGTSTHTLNGVKFTTGTLQGREVVLFLRGISVVNAAMTAQLALDHFNVERIVFSGIAGGVDPARHIGDVVIADRWGQYLEHLYARKIEDGWQTTPFFEYPYANFGMMFPRSITVTRAGAEAPETRFWFPVDDALLAAARAAAAKVELERCTVTDRCLQQVPEVVVGGPGVSGGAFIDNAAFREYAFETFGARVLDMESAAVAHVAYANGVPFIAVRSLSDLAGGAGENQMEVFLGLAAGPYMPYLLRQPALGAVAVERVQCSAAEEREGAEYPPLHLVRRAHGAALRLAGGPLYRIEPAPDEGVATAVRGQDRKPRRVLPQHVPEQAQSWLGHPVGRRVLRFLLDEPCEPILVINQDVRPSGRPIADVKQPNSVFLPAVIRQFGRDVVGSRFFLQHVGRMEPVVGQDRADQ